MSVKPSLARILLPLVTLALVGCTAHPVNESAGSRGSSTSGQSTPAPTRSSGIATNLPPSPPTRPSGGGSNPIEVVADPGLLALLPTEHAGVRFVGHDLARGGPAPIEDELLRGIRDVAADAASTVSAAWIEADPAANDPTFGIRVVAVRIHGATGLGLRRAFVAAMLLRPGISELNAVESLGKNAVAFNPFAFAYADGDALIVVTFKDISGKPAQGPSPTPNEWPFDTFFAILPASDPIVQPIQPAAPSLDPDLTSPEPDPSAATLLPAAVTGVPIRGAATGRGSSILTNYILALPAYALYQSGLSFDMGDVSAAAGVTDGLSTYTVIATRIPGVSRLQLLAAWFNNLLERGGPVGEVEVIDVAGRRVQLYNAGTQAVFAADGLLYWMEYLDLGDFAPSPPPRPALRELVIDTVRNLPPIVDTGG